MMQKPHDGQTFCFFPILSGSFSFYLCPLWVFTIDTPPARPNNAGTLLYRSWPICLAITFGCNPLAEASLSPCWIPLLQKPIKRQLSRCAVTIYDALRHKNSRQLSALGDNLPTFALPVKNINRERMSITLARNSQMYFKCGADIVLKIVPSETKLFGHY